MNRRSFTAALFGPLALSGRFPVRAGDAEDGLVSLFDGKTLNGWSVREGPESAFYVKDGSIVAHQGSNFPTWLRSNRQYENFDLRLEYFVKGWMNSGVYLHAPEHGRNTWIGLKINIFQKHDDPPLAESNGAIFPLLAPKVVHVKSKGEWNSLRVLMDWPSLRIWSNEAEIHNLDVEANPELRYRLRKGYLGFESLSYPIQFRNIRIKELPSKDNWTTLYEDSADIRNWTIAEGKATWETLGPVLRSDGLGYLATSEKFRNFEFQSYIRASRHSNGGIIFRGAPGNTAHYEIQLHDVEGAIYPTGSLYGYRRSLYPKIDPQEWYLLQLIVNGKQCIVRINGENVVEYDNLQLDQEAPIMLQAHQNNRWIEYKQIRIKRLG
jgi:hypothetical protein